MNRPSKPVRKPVESLIADIRRATRRQLSSSEKLRIVLQSLRGEYSIAEPCRREAIASSIQYGWSKQSLDAGKKRLAGDAARAATADEVRGPRGEASVPKEAVAGLARVDRLPRKV